MRTLLKTIVLALIVAFASTAFAQDSQTSPQSQDGDDASTSSRPLPLPYDGDQGDSNTADAKTDVERAEMLLMGYHGLPSKEVFEDNLDQPKVVLTAIALDEDGFSLRRKRALEALGYWADAGVLRHYIKLLQDDQTPESLRHALILAIAKHFPDQALGHLKPYLAHNNLQYRLSAIEAIRRLPGDEAIEALRAALKRETNAVAKKRLENYTRVLR